MTSPTRVFLSQVINSRVSAWLTDESIRSVSTCLQWCRVLAFTFVIWGEDAAVSEELRQRSRWAEFLSAGWATAWQWEDASSSLSLLFNLLFLQSVAACFPICIGLYAAVRRRSFYRLEPEGTARAQVSANAGLLRLDLAQEHIFFPLLLISWLRLICSGIATTDN